MRNAHLLSTYEELVLSKTLYMIPWPHSVLQLLHTVQVNGAQRHRIIVTSQSQRQSHGQNSLMYSSVLILTYQRICEPNCTRIENILLFSKKFLVSLQYILLSLLSLRSQLFLLTHFLYADSFFENKIHPFIYFKNIYFFIHLFIYLAFMGLGGGHVWYLVQTQGPCIAIPLFI